MESETQPQENQERRTKSGTSGKNILSGVKRASDQEQREAVTKNKNIEKDSSGRITHIENQVKENAVELAQQKTFIQEINTNLTKGLFGIVILSVAFSSYHGASLINGGFSGFSFEKFLAFIASLLLSYFGVKSTYQYTKQHPEAGSTKEQLGRATQEFVEEMTQYVIVKKNK